MEAFVERLVKERDDLKEKTGKITAFLDSDNTVVLSDVERELLAQQLGVMTLYRNILTQRIALYVIE